MRRLSIISTLIASFGLAGCHITASNFACNGPNECPSPYVCDETFHCSMPVADSGIADSGTDAGQPFDAGSSDAGHHDAGTDAGMIGGGDGGCSDNNGGCGTAILNGVAAGRCSDSTGTVVCNCNTGFDLEGSTCVDACGLSNGNCGDTSQGTCDHNPAGNAVICVCNPGYQNANGSGPNGTGSTCVPDPCAVDGGACGATTSLNCESDGGVVTACVCEPGYVNIDGGPGSPCADSCSVNNGGCGTGVSDSTHGSVPAGTCSHSDAGNNAVVCACNTGWVLVGGTCVDQCTLNSGEGFCGSGCFCSHKADNSEECACS